jgi:hypothetical protein
MPLATKNNAIIVKGGKLAEDCACCGGWYCHIGFCANAFVGSTAYKVNGQVVQFANSTYIWSESTSHQTLGTVSISGFAQRVELVSPCQFYLKLVIEVTATGSGGYKTFFWSPIFNADDYGLGGPVSDSVSDSNVQARQQANGFNVTGTYNAPQYAQAWSSYGTPTFSVEMTFDLIADARCV